jgi:hypothetical protein
MRSRHFLGVTIICGALGTLGGQTVKAQAPSSERFVRLLLMNESALIQKDTKALTTRNADIAKLNSATNSRQIRQLGKTLSRLNQQILSLTTRLQVFSTQVYNTAHNLTPSNPSLVSSALANLLIVQQLSIQANLGINPATPMQQ